MSKRTRPGDILTTETADGSIFLHYVGTHPNYGDAVLVCPTLHREPVTPSAELFRSAYLTFYPVRAALAKDLVRVVGAARPPKVPLRLRRAGYRSGTTISNWIIESPNGELLRWELSPEELALPIASIWNHEFLVERVRLGWRPELEGKASG